MTTKSGEIVKQDRIGRVRTTRSQREAMLAEYEGSGMSGPEYAEYIGVKYPTFATWLQRRKQESGELGTQGEVKERSALQWVEAVVEKAAEPGETEGLVIRLGGGAEMTVRNVPGARLAAEVLRQLGGVRGC